MGKPRNSHAAALHDDYAERLRRMGVQFESPWVAEERPGGRFSDEHVKQREGRRLIESLEDGERAVALDRRGEALASAALAQHVQRWIAPKAAFLLGGPLGHADAVLARADAVWSLGPLTLPHELARVVAIEQLYRAYTLLRGVPYHK